MGIISGFIIGVLICIFHVFVHYIQAAGVQSFDPIVSPQKQPPQKSATTIQFKTKHKQVKPKQVRSEQTKPQTDKQIIDLVISGLVHLGMKKTQAKSLVLKMCKDKCYTCEQHLFEVCFPHIN